MKFIADSKKISSLFFVIIVIFYTNGFAQNVNPTFKPVIKGFPEVTALEILSDGKILLAGNVSSSGKVPTGAVMKLNRDGTLDKSFRAPFYDGKQGNITTLAVDFENKIMIGSIDLNLGERGYLVRLNPDGSFDESFMSELAFMNIKKVYCQQDGKYLVSAIYQNPDYSYQTKILRLNNNGSIDLTFNFYIDSNYRYSPGDFKVQPDGKILIVFFDDLGSVRNCKLLRLNNDGALDSDFQQGTFTITNGSQFYDIEIQTDGKIVFSSEFEKFNNFDASRIIRLNTDGSIDNSIINTTIINSVLNASISDIQMCPNNQILIVGLSNNNYKLEYNAVMINGDGSSVPTFQIPDFQLALRNPTKTFAAINNDRIYFAGDFISCNNKKSFGIVALDFQGELSENFKPEIGANPIINAVFQQNDGKVIIGGEFSQVDSFYVNNIARFNKNGTTDTTFIKNIGTGPDLQVRSIGCLSDSSIIIGGDFLQVDGLYNVYLAKLKPNGLVDQDFDAKIWDMYVGLGINKVLVDSNNHIYIGGFFDYIDDVKTNRFAVLNPDGTLYYSLAENQLFTLNHYWIYDMAFQSNKNLIIGGRIIYTDETNYHPYDTGFLTRLNSDGTIDNSFPNSILNKNFSSLKVLADDRIMVGDEYFGFGTANVTQLDANGNIIDQNSIEIFKGKDDRPIIDCIQNPKEDQLIIGGIFSSVNGVEKPALAKVSLNGDVDQYFKYDVDGRIKQFFQQDSTHLFVVGEFNRIGNDSDLFCIARIDINFPQTPSNLNASISTLKSTNSSGIRLDWIDQSYNELGFSIEKSIDKKNFISIGNVNNNTYSYNDSDIEKDKKYYYRVKAYNTNGGSSYTNIAEIADVTTLKIENNKELFIYPNPGNGQLVLHFTDFAEINPTIEIYNLSGKCIFKNNTRIKEKNFQIPVDISKVPSGIYLIQIKYNDISKSIKYMKQ